MSARLKDYDYSLPRELIAQRPLKRREDSRMMVMHRAEQKIEHRRFRELKSFLQPGDLVVLNDTRVLAARRFSDDGAIEFLFLERLGSQRWKCLVRPGRKMRVGARAMINGVALKVEEVTDNGERIVNLDEGFDVYAGGSMPLPLYIDRLSEQEDSSRYQTVFARAPGAIAAPTAGLHFTGEILSEIPHAFVTLHVGSGTFLPVRADDVAEHRMHAERFSISPDATNKINQAERVVAVGTTVVRALETAARQSRLTKKIVGQPRTLSGVCSAGAAPTVQEFREDKFKKPETEPQPDETELFIYPPYCFRIVDVLLTNFHLPRSTLLMLVSAFAGREFLRRGYEEAIRERYRFYSYGDCMLIL